MNRYGSEQGFTLIELIVVMVLISMMSALAFPKIRSTLFTNQLRATARRFIGLVAATGQEARSKMIEVQLRFDPEQHRFITAPVSATATEFPERNFAEISVPESVQVVDVTSVHGGRKSRGELVIRFSPQGYVDKTLVHFRDNDEGEELTVFLSPFLGVTRVFEGYVFLDDDRLIWAKN